MGKLSLEEMERDFGFITGVKISSGGRRFRLSHHSGLFFERIEAPVVSSGAWEKACFHKGLIKTCVVERGWVGTARKLDDMFDFSVAEERSVINFAPGTPYNIFLPERAIIVVITHGDMAPKHGNPSRSNIDFWPVEVLDAACEQYRLQHFQNQHKHLSVPRSAQDVVAKG
jgi:hypothetical protein